MGDKEEFLNLWEAIFDAADTSGDGIVLEDELSVLSGKIKDQKKRKMIREMFRGNPHAHGSGISKKQHMKFGHGAWDHKGPFPKEVLDTLRSVGQLSDAGKKLREGKDNAIKELKAMFDRYDADKSGTLDAKELKYLAAQMGAPLDAKELAEALDAMDADKSGEISFDELYAWWAKGKRAKKSNTKLAALYAGAVSEYMSESVTAFFKDLNKKDDKETIALNGKIQFGNISIKDAKSTLSVDIVDLKQMAISEDASFSVTWVFASDDAKASADFVKLVTGKVDQLKASPMFNGMPRELRGAIDHLEVKQDSKTNDVSLTVWTPHESADPFARMVKHAPFDITNIVKAFSFKFGFPFEMESLLKSDEPFLDQLKVVIDGGYDISRTVMTAMVNAMTKRKRRPERDPGIILSLLMTVAFKSGTAKYSFESPKKILKGLQAYDALRRVLPPKQALEMKLGDLYKMAKSALAAAIAFARTQKTPEPMAWVREVPMLFILALGKMKQVKELRLSAKSVKKQLIVGFNGLIPLSLLPTKEEIDSVEDPEKTMRAFSSLMRMSGRERRSETAPRERKSETAPLL